MTTRTILTITLLATSLTLNAIVPQTTIEHQQVQQNSISKIIESSLFQRGIDKSKAQELSQVLIGSDEELASLMIHNYIHTTGLKHEDVYFQLGNLALMQQKIDFSSYSFLIKFTQMIQSNSINSQELAKIASLSTKNTLLRKVFA